MPEPHKNPIGVIDIAFMWSFYYLKKETSYKDALRDFLLRGGDTDTNAAIMGGLLGAAEGIDGINKDQIDKVLKFDPTVQGGHKRPDFLIPKDKLLPKILKIYKERPESLKVTWGDKKSITTRKEIEDHFKNELHLDFYDK